MVSFYSISTTLFSDDGSHSLSPYLLDIPGDETLPPRVVPGSYVCCFIKPTESEDMNLPSGELT